MLYTVCMLFLHHYFVCFCIAPVLQRFVRRTVNSSFPLCYDVDASISLKLLHNPNRGHYWVIKNTQSFIFNVNCTLLYMTWQLCIHFVLELSMNGQLDSFPNGGFQKIVIHNKNQHIDINLDLIRVHDGQNATEILWEQNTINIQRWKTHILQMNTSFVTPQHMHCIFMLFFS